MGAIFRDATIEWDGASYTLSPSNRLLRQIDREVNLFQMVRRANAGEASLPELAFVLATCLQSAGADRADVTEDRIIQQLLHNADVVLPLARQVMAALMPEDLPAKNVEAPSEAKRKAGKTKAK